MTCLSITFNTQKPVSLAGGVFTAPRMCNALKVCDHPNTDKCSQ